MLDGIKLKGIPLKNMLQVLGDSKNKVWLKVVLKDGREGNIWLDKGNILHAVLNELFGVEALREMLSSEYSEVVIFKEFSGSVVNSINEPVEDVLKDIVKELVRKEREELIKQGRDKMIEQILKKLKSDIPHCLGVGVFHTMEGLMIGAVTDIPNYDHDVAGAAYSTMMSSIKKALAIRGEGIYVNIRDVLVETDDKYLYVRTLGNTDYAIVVAMSKEGNLGYLRAMLKKVEPDLVKALA